jgi:archaeosine-15-forming tRNA-guanine transglycosylase
MNELISTSKKAFVKFIAGLVENMKTGSHLLVVDSAGSFSEAQVNGHEYMYGLISY